MSIVELSEEFSICKIQDTSSVDFSKKFMFLSKTDEEVSLVCESEYVPNNAIDVESGWRAIRIAGVLGFDLIGVIAGITSILAENNISVFAISTYNTDYVLVKSSDFDKSLALLENHK